MQDITDNQIIALCVCAIFVYYMAEMAWTSVIAIFHRKK